MCRRRRALESLNCLCGPFYPAYLAAMNLVVMADDAFSFLVSWEFMSLTSWALVIGFHEVSSTSAANQVASIAKA